jgi:hypothetical protein
MAILHRIASLLEMGGVLEVVARLRQRRLEKSVSAPFQT